ncbi:hypothetical protein IE53DRAFT_251068 [Violaceomyces palustris]|uniref:Uncharacterized protein n=1 Tax=Violaceomyces palustris TaxID=1673888 RepID=A0ACD0NNN3_9BASI|nr:hypothetical protein IE53DRAFT_251068 [Violaceomyces palustris]
MESGMDNIPASNSRTMLYQASEFGSMVDISIHQSRNHSSCRRRASGDDHTSNIHSSSSSLSRGRSIMQAESETDAGADGKVMVSEGREQDYQGGLSRGFYRTQTAESSSTTLNIDPIDSPFVRDERRLKDKGRHPRPGFGSTATLLDRQDALEKLCGSKSSSGISTPSMSPEHSLYASQAKKKYVPPMLLLGPVVAVLILTAGLATGMAIWVYTHKLPLTSDGVIYVHEGAEDEMDRPYTDKTLGSNNTLRFNTQIAHATTLSFSSIISTLVGNSVYLLMSLVAYSLAADWLLLQARVAESPSASVTEQLPTPLQYALLLQLCGANSFEALTNTMHHVFRNKGSCASVPSLLKKAFTWLVVLWTLTTAIGWTDFWLHETTKTVQVINVNPEPVSKPYSMQLNSTLCSDSLDLAKPPCLVSRNETTGMNFFATDTRFGEEYVEPEGWYTVNEVSKVHQVISLEGIDDDEDDRAESSGTSSHNMRFIAPRAKVEEIFTISTVGASTTCQMITERCNPTKTSFDCRAAGFPRLDSRTTDKNFTSTLFWGERGDNVAGTGEVVGPSTNPVSISALLTYSLADEASLEETGFENFDMNLATWTYGMAACQMTYYNLNLSYFNGTYSILGKSMANSSLVHALSGPLVAGTITNPSIAQLSNLVGRLSKEEFAGKLSSSLSHFSLGVAAGLFSTENVSALEWESILASQYDKGPLYLYLALLYSYALVAVILFFWAWGLSSDCVAYDCPKTGKKIQVPAAVLAQRVLMDPGHVIACFLGGSQRHAHNATSASVTAMLAHATGMGLGLGSYPTPAQEGESKVHGGWSSPGNLDMRRSLSQQQLLSFVPINRQAAIRTTSTDLLGLFDEPPHQERVVVGLESGGRGFGVWPMSQAMGAVGLNGSKRDSMLRARNFFSHHHHNNNKSNHQQFFRNRDGEGNDDPRYMA